MGSHLDTVVRGGWLDGAFGVAAAVEALRVLAELGPDLACEPVAVAFANEEGALIQEPLLGLAGAVRRAGRGAGLGG